MPDNTAEIIKKVCDTISQPSGDQLLKLLRAMFQGQSSKQLSQTFPTSLIDQAGDLGMTQGIAEDLSLTTEGFLVANVAKEYWNWIDQGLYSTPPENGSSPSVNERAFPSTSPLPWLVISHLDRRIR